MIAMPSAINWPAWSLAVLWDAWAARLNPRYVVSREQLDQLDHRLAEWRTLFDSLDSSSPSSR